MPPYTYAYTYTYLAYTYTSNYTCIYTYIAITNPVRMFTSISIPIPTSICTFLFYVQLMNVKKQAKIQADRNRNVQLSSTDYKANRVIVDAPMAMVLYNHNMAGVDKYDHNRQGRNAVDKTFKTRVWYRKLIMGLFGFAVTNAWLFWKSG
jgi:c-di-AMP phosphodiesterase-like protein